MSVLDRFSLRGKVAIVTGASSGLGAAFAVALAEAGASVVLVARRVERLNSVLSDVELRGRSGLVLGANVTSPDECEGVAADAYERFGAIDVLINGAGVGVAVPATRETPEQFRQVIDINLLGTYWMAQACAKRMTPGSTIINVSSVLAFTTARHPQAAYSASKAAVIGLTRDLAQQWSGRRGIRVNALVPGYFPTEMTANLSEEYVMYIANERVPMKRLGEIEECSAAAVFLASDASSYVNGTSLFVDGGLTIT